MKNLLNLLMIVLLPVLVYSQNSEKSDSTTKQEKYEIKTLASRDIKSHGGYFGLTTNYSRIMGQDAYSVGVRFGYVMDHIFMIGLGGGGFVNDMPFDNIIAGQRLYLQGGYAGIVLEPIIAGKYPVHVTLPLLIGGGAMLYNREGYYQNIGEYPRYTNWEIVDSDAFFVIEPALNLEFNITKFFRLGLEAKYRYTNKLNLINTSSRALNGWSGGLGVKFGKF